MLHNIAQVPMKPRGFNRSDPGSAGVQFAAWLCLLLSILFHTGLVALGAAATPVFPSIDLPEPGGDESQPPPDNWVGETFDIDTSPANPAEPAPAAAPAVPVAPKTPQPPVSPPSPDPDPAPATLPAIEPDGTEPASPVDAGLPEAATPEDAATEAPKDASPEPDPPTPEPSSSAPASNPVPSVPAGTSAGIASASPPAAGGPAGSFGAAGRRRGVRNLATAFARAMPIANSGDPVWKTLPMGAAGVLEVTLEVDDRGKIAGARPKDGARAPQHLVRLVERTLSLLRAGRFALSTTQDTAGSEGFRLEARIEQVAVASAGDGSTAGPYALGFKAPRSGAPGHATFTLQNGRKVTIDITLLPN